MCSVWCAVSIAMELWWDFVWFLVVITIYLFLVWFIKTRKSFKNYCRIPGHVQRFMIYCEFSGGYGLLLHTLDSVDFIFEMSLNNSSRHGSMSILKRVNTSIVLALCWLYLKFTQPNLKYVVK